MLIELALASMLEDATAYSVTNTNIELRCRCDSQHVELRVDYTGARIDDAALVEVPHLSILRAASPYRSDVGLSTPVARVIAAAHGSAIESISDGNHQTIRVSLKSRRSEE